MQQPLFKSAFNKSKVIPFEKQTENQNLFKSISVFKQLTNPNNEPQPIWNNFTAQDLEILSSIVTFATFISCSSKITTTSYINIFRAHDIVLRKRNINPKSNKLYYQSLLKLSMEPGESWFQKFENIVKNLGYMTDSNIYKWILSVTSKSNHHIPLNDDNSKKIELSTVENKEKNESLTTSTDQLDVILNDSMSYQSNNLDDDCIDFKQSDKIILSKFSPKEKVKLKNILRNWKSYTIQVRQNRTKVVQQLRLSINFYQKNLLKKFFKKFHKSCKSVQSKRILLKKESDAFYISNFFNKCQAIIFDNEKHLKQYFISWNSKTKIIKRQVRLAKKYHFNCSKEFLLDVMNNWHSIAVNKSTKNALLTKSYKIWRTKFIYSLLTKDNQQIMLDKYFEILNSVPKRYAYFDDDINKTLTQKAFEKWKERYKNYILLSEVADVKALQRRKIMSKTASVPLLNRCLLEWYSRTIQKYKQKEHERKLALEVLRVLERAISDFKEAQSSNTSSLLNCQETLFNNIRNMTDDSNTIKDLEEENKELKSQIKKFGKEKEKLIKKTQSLGASKQHFKTKSEKRVSTIRSLVRKSGNFSENEFKNQVGQVSMHSTVECLQLVYQFLIGEKPKKWLSHSTLSTWHQEVANLEVHSTITQLSEVNSYGIMVDESTHGENKYLVIVFAFWSYVENFPLAKVIELKVISKCDSVTIATNVLNLIEEKKLDPKACSVWITDNTAYMSGKHNGAVLKYNRMSSSNAVRIG
ncbi:16443_t:CDS:10, partial [Entrophospora sp. SA101]